MQADAIIVAAGSSQRFGMSDKLLAGLAGRPVLAWSLAAHNAAKNVAKVVIVAHTDHLTEIEALASEWLPNKVFAVVAGGARRRDSVEAGMSAVSSDYVSIHDGARPLATAQFIDACITAAENHDGATAASPVADTIKEVADGFVNGHPPRASLWAVQTPQVVRRDDWLAAAALSGGDETDDTAMIARLGRRARVVESPGPNLKITAAADLVLAAALLSKEPS